MKLTVRSKIIILILLAIVAILFSFHSGPVHLDWEKIYSYFRGVPLAKEDNFLIGAIRLPRTLAAFIVGAALGACGLVLQTLLQNPLAEPYTLGLSGGGSLGAVVALYLGLEPGVLWVPTLSTIGCIGATILVLGLGRRRLAFESRSLILFGVMISLFFGALVVTGLSILSPVQLQSALFWLLGQFGTSRDVWIYPLATPVIICLAIILSRSSALDAMSLGEGRAFSLGYSPRFERTLLILICTLITALAVSISGLVGFIGLVSPHLSRRILKTSRHRYLIMASLLIGGALLTLADSLARNIGTSEIPAGSIAALVGAPLLLILLTDKANVAVE